MEPHVLVSRYSFKQVDQIDAVRDVAVEELVQGAAAAAFRGLKLME